MKKLIYPFLLPVLVFLAGCAPKSEKAFYYTKLDGRPVLFPWRFLSETFMK